MANSSKTDDDKGVQAPILTVNGITKSFGGLVAIDDVSFELYEEEIFGLIGPNGAGKTTLFNLIAGLLHTKQGIIQFRDDVINGLRPDQICKKGIARTFQLTKPFLSMTVIENVLVSLYFGTIAKKNIKKCIHKAEEILAFIGLEEKANESAANLNLMERKSLELARALSTEPSVLLLDEVTGGLNPIEAAKMVDIIREIRNKGIAVLLIEHVMKTVMTVSERIFVLDHGVKIAEGKPEEIASNHLVIEAYLGTGGYA